MDQRIESFLTDVLALAGEDPDAVRQGVRVALADCEALFRVREPNKRMRERRARLPRAVPLSRPRGMHQRGGSRLAEHLKLVLSIIDRQGRVEP
jgi:hypothetical protein